MYGGGHSSPWAPHMAHSSLAIAGTGGSMGVLHLRGNRSSGGKVTQLSGKKN